MSVDLVCLFVYLSIYSSEKKLQNDFSGLLFIDMFLSKMNILVLFYKWLMTLLPNSK